MQEIQHSLRADGARDLDDLRAIQLPRFCQGELEDLSKPARSRFIKSMASPVFYLTFILASFQGEIRVCADMSCHLNGACELRADLERRFANMRPRTCRFGTFPVLAAATMPRRFDQRSHFHGRYAARAEQIARGPFVAKRFMSRIAGRRVECKADPYGDAEKYGVARKLIQSTRIR